MPIFGVEIKIHASMDKKPSNKDPPKDTKQNANLYLNYRFMQNFAMNYSQLNKKADRIV